MARLFALAALIFLAILASPVNAQQPPNCNTVDQVLELINSNNLQHRVITGAADIARAKGYLPPFPVEPTAIIIATNGIYAWVMLAQHTYVCHVAELYLSQVAPLLVQAPSRNAEYADAL